MAQFYTNYYSQDVMSDPQRWLRFVKGQVDYRSISRNLFQTILWNRLTAFIFQIKLAFLKKTHPPQIPTGEIDPAKYLRLMVEREVKLLFIYNEGSSGLDYARMLLGQEFERLLAAKKLQLEIIPASDHLFTLLAGQAHLLKVVQEWVQTVQQPYQETTPLLVA
jgi:hypothetical protein